MDRRRMMMSIRRDLVIFKYGNDKLSNGELWRSGNFDEGTLNIKCKSNGDGTYRSDPNYISGISFGKHENLCIRLNVPSYATLQGSKEFLMAAGYGPASASVSNPDEWTKAIRYTAEGFYTSKIPLDEIKEGDVIFLLANGGTTSGVYAEMEIHDIWLE